MNETMTMAFALAAGVALGAMFFGGLWWTTQKGLASDRPVLWFLGSQILRTSITLAGFYFVSDGHWKRLLMCLLGFILARQVVIRLTRATKGRAFVAPETKHAP